MSKLIPILGKRGLGKFAIVDDEDFDSLNQFKWYLGIKGYPVRSCKKWESFSQRGIRMHQMILPPKEGFEIDHRNRIPLDNRRANLRYATVAQNRANARPHSDSTSPYKGVRWKPNRQKWYASISHNKKTMHIGVYETEEEAARAYDHAALFYHGEFAYLNFPLVVDHD